MATLRLRVMRVVSNGYLIERHRWFGWEAVAARDTEQGARQFADGVMKEWRAIQKLKRLPSTRIHELAAGG
ncbi:hypothetical protein GURKE_02910 [Brevundimonas phage vB_BpoS-Gurke]|uniref:Uncharacterized protein n=1 Tax=Brevundimonas phage vB_BpoS-Gurke TaxID=2948599 RepID=A0A9E7N4F2_9CAUD|nr:hypothetical protein GURKE_02910 [Brevundimonas phage vB_BpoS-Gurke]